LEALSKSLDRPIEVVQAVGPPLTFGDSNGKKKLTIAYYRHAFGLGEHYESTEPIGQEEPAV
jgi:OTU domain-containing protein 6